MHRVEWRASAANTRSLAAAERLGMTREGVLRQSYPHRGVRQDTEVWAVLAHEWPPPAAADGSADGTADASTGGTTDAAAAGPRTRPRTGPRTGPPARRPPPPEPVSLPPPRGSRCSSAVAPCQWIRRVERPSGNAGLFEPRRVATAAESATAIGAALGPAAHGSARVPDPRHASADPRRGRRRGTATPPVTPGRIRTPSTTGTFRFRRTRCSARHSGPCRGRPRHSPDRASRGRGPTVRRRGCRAVRDRRPGPGAGVAGRTPGPGPTCGDAPGR